MASESVTVLNVVNDRRSRTVANRGAGGVRGCRKRTFLTSCRRGVWEAQFVSAFAPGNESMNRYMIRSPTHRVVQG
jgi:hypothetical protein